MLYRLYFITFGQDLSVSALTNRIELSNRETVDLKKVLQLFSLRIRRLQKSEGLPSRLANEPKIFTTNIE